MHVSCITVIRHSKLRMGCNYNGLFCFNNTYNEVLLYSNFLHGWLDECNHRPVFCAHLQGSEGRRRVISAPSSESAPKGYILSEVKQLKPPITRCCRHPNHAGSGRADLSHGGDRDRIRRGRFPG